MKKLFLACLSVFLLLWITSAQGPGTGNIGLLPGVGYGTSGSIGGGALLAGSCASGAVTITGSTVGQPAIATPSDGTNIAASGLSITATVTAANTVTVNVCALLAVTPIAKTYNVRVLP